MTAYGAIFYGLAAVVVACTALAVTRRDLVHAVVYLIGSFLGTALLFYLLGAPFLAAMEVIIYAGAILVVFLFVLMTVKAEPGDGPRLAPSRWGSAAAIGALFLVILGVLLAADPAARAPLEAAVATPAAFGRQVFTRHALAVEVASLLLLAALAGALFLGRERSGKGEAR
ncbi:MAG: NADH-quinone oxidoreductase subunit J [Proteobacteria bacterium]|nr:NADH-quinone oxidoreductase subunit J [Pseudomonadota bacterium]